MGETFSFTVTVQNNSPHDTEVALLEILVQSKSYDGKRKNLVKVVTVPDCSIQGNGGKYEHTVDVECDEYFGKLIDGNYFSLSGSVRIDDANNDDKLYIDHVWFELTPPSGCINISCENLINSQVGDSIKCFVEVQNPLKYTMHGFSVTVEVMGVANVAWEPEQTEIESGKSVCIGSFQFTPRRRGECVLHIDVDSQEVHDLKHEFVLIVG